MFWTYDIDTNLEKADLAALKSADMFNCIDNIPKIVESYESEQKNKAIT